MPLFVIIGRDAPDSKDKRPAARADHLEYWKPLDEAGRVVVAGPLADFAGSLFVFQAENIEEAVEIADNDPYVAAGVFESSEVHGFKGVLPNLVYG
ncbi:MAG: YciI family protein [Sumerlaeia bacterium]